MKFSEWIESQGRNVVAKKLGVSTQSICFWLQGATSPRWPTMLKIVRLSKGRLTLDGILKEQAQKKRPLKWYK